MSVPTDQDTACAHRDDHWRCAAEGCGRLQCARCDGVPNDAGTCWECFTAEDDAAVAS